MKEGMIHLWQSIKLLSLSQLLDYSMAAGRHVYYTVNVYFNKLPWINNNSVPLGALSVEIRMKQRFQRQYQTTNGDMIMIDDRHIGPDRGALFDVPFHVLALPLDRELYFWNQLSALIDDPIPCMEVSQGTASLVFDMASRNGNGINYQLGVVAELEVMTVELVDDQSINDQIQSILLELEESGDDSGRKGASKSVIEGLKKERFKFKGKGKGTCCVVCLEELLGGTEVTRMLCSHVFHHGCIVQWLQETNSCPVCRYVLPD